MRRLVLLVTVGMMFGGSASSARADNWWTEFWGGVHDGWHRNNAWPEPFIYQDRETVAAPFGAMINKGWERQNLLSEYHFEDGAHALVLNQAGQLKVRWILTQAPQSQRIIYVQRGTSPAQTQARMLLVQQAAVAVVGPGESPSIAVSNMDASGWSAENVDAIYRKAALSRPDPRLPKPQGDSGGASGSSGGK